MTATVTLFDPTAPARAGDAGAKRAATTLAGAIVGFIDNAKPNFHFLVDDLADVLTGKYGVAKVVKRRKPSASVPAKPEVMDALTGECDVVIAGSGD